MKNQLIDHEEIHMGQDTNRINNIIVGLAVGIMIAICAVIYVGASYLEAVNY